MGSSSAWQKEIPCSLGPFSASMSYSAGRDCLKPWRLLRNLLIFLSADQGSSGSTKPMSQEILLQQEAPPEELLSISWCMEVATCCYLPLLHFPVRHLPGSPSEGKAHLRYGSTDRAGQEKCRAGYSCLMRIEAEPCVSSGQLHTHAQLPSPPFPPSQTSCISQMATTKRWCRCGQKNEDLTTSWCFNHKVEPLP